jgi:hypothetical protein
MKTIEKLLLVPLALLALACLATATLAHQPTIVGQEIITIEKPEISRAFYGELSGQPRSFFVKADEPFDLYVGLLVPRNTNAAGRYSARVYRVVGGQKIILNDLRADSVAWKEYYEPFGGDHYVKGPEWKSSVPAGGYEIEVYSANDLGKYVLVIGEKESWGPQEILNVYTELPILKGDFFGGHPASFLISPFGIALIVAIGGILFYLFRR